MTKLKSKKMTKSTLAIIIMGIAIVALLAFGGSFAYFSATSQDTKTGITMGTVKLSDNGAIASITAGEKFPGDTIVAAEGLKLTVDTTDTTGNYVAIRFTVSAQDAGGDAIADITTSLGLNVVGALDTTWAQIYSHTGETTTYDLDSSNSGVATGIYVYKAATSAAAKAADDAQIVVNASAITLNATDVWAEGALASNNELMGAEITITMDARSIQGSNIDTADAYGLLVGLFA